MDWRKLREQCLALPGSVEEFPFGDEVSVFKVGGKMFALSHLDGEPLQMSVADEMVCDLLGDSYELVVASLPKARRPSGGFPPTYGTGGALECGRIGPQRRMCLLIEHRDQAFHDHGRFTVCPDCKSFAIMERASAFAAQCAIDTVATNCRGQARVFRPRRRGRRAGKG